MSSFIADFQSNRERSYCGNNTNFVAEFRPKQNMTHTDTRVAHVLPRTISTSPSNSLVSEGSGENGEDLLHILSEKKFSKERITQLLHGSIVSLIETLFAGRLMSKITGNIQVSLHTDPNPISVSLEKEYGAFKCVDSDLNVLRKGCTSSCNFTQSRFSPENVRGPSYSPANILSEQDRLEGPTNGVHGDTSVNGKHQLETMVLNSTQDRDSLRTSSENTLSRRDSDEESGYNSTNEQPTLSPNQLNTPVMNYEVKRNLVKQNAVSCSENESTKMLESDVSRNKATNMKTFSGSRSTEIMMCDNRDLEDSRLMIDLSSDNSEECAAKLTDSKCYFSEMTSDDDVHSAARVPEVFAESSSMEREDLMNHCVEKSLRSPPNVGVDIEPTNGSEITDFETDCPTDPVGEEDSSKPSDVLPHPQSMVSKLSSGLLCKLCLHSLPDEDSVTTHAFEKHNLFSCSFCFRTFTAKNNLKRHIRLHTGLRPYRCPHCSHSFARRDDLKGHMLRHDYSKPFRCAICKKGYTDRACVKNHMAKEHGSRLMHVCPQCGESFDKDDAFSVHKQSHPELKQYSCKVCFFIGTNNLMTMKHSLIHEHGLFACKPCNAYFADPFDYTNHVRKHKSNSEFTSYVCCFCKMNLSSYEQFVRHEYSHAQGKSYSCGTCNKQFKSKAAFQDHSISHIHHISESIDDEPEQPSDVVEGNCCDPTNHRQSASGENGVEEVSTSMEIDGPSPSDAMLSNQRVSCQSGPKCSVRQNCASATNDLDTNLEVLDLSVKKITIPFLDSTKNTTDAKNALRRFAPSTELRELNINRVPRNGYMSEFTGTSSGDKSFRSFSSDTDESINNRMYIHHYDQLNNAASTESLSWNNAHIMDPRMIDRVDSQQRTTVSHGSGHNTEIVSTPNYPLRAFARSASGAEYRRPLLRMSPYSRGKIMDLASKFMAARGPLIPFPKRQAMKNTNNFPAENRGTYCAQPLPAWPIQELAISSEEKIPRRGSHSSEKMYTSVPYISRESVEQGPVSPISRQLPTFIKSEPFFDNKDQTRFSTDLNNCRVPVKNTSTESKTNKNYDCDICKVMFHSFQELENHSILLHKKYLCEHCGKDFTARPNRDRHVRYHTGERPYKCDLCDQAFFRGDDLKYHRTTRHPSAQPFSCTRCSATFTYSKDLERHIRQSKCKV